MWLLIGDNDGRLIYLKPNTTMTVGRNKGAIILSDDCSISRVHAQIIVKPSLELDKITDKTQPLSLCTIKDPGSKYGNFILKDNDETIRISDQELHHMDKIRFGLQNYIFTVHYIPIITATSGMSVNEKEKLEKLIAQIDGKMSYVWTALCSHMTVERPTISEKFSCALASQTPIVSMGYWNEIAKCFAENKPLPDPTAFVESIDDHFREMGGQSVSPNIARKTLFNNLTFVHFNSKQYHTYARMIKLAGGKSLQYGRQRMNPDVSDENVIVVQLVESNTTQATGTGDAQYATVCEKLSQLRRRTIPESEIPMAILHCSIDKNCNPRFDYATLFENQRQVNVPQTGSVLAVDTQDHPLPAIVRPQQIRSSNNCIPETIDESCNVESVPARNYQVKSDKSREETSSKKFEISLAEPSNFEMGSIKVASINHENYMRKEFDNIAIEKVYGKRIHENDEEQNEVKKKICLSNASVLSVDDGKDNYNGVCESLEHSVSDDQNIFYGDVKESIGIKELENKREKPKVANFFTLDKQLENKQEKSSILSFFNNEKEIDKKQEKPSVSSFFFGNKREMENKREEENIASTSKDEKIIKEKGEKRWSTELEKRKLVTRPEESPSPDAIENPYKKTTLTLANLDKNYENPKKKTLTDSTPDLLQKNVIKKEENSWINGKMECSDFPDNPDTSMVIFLRMDALQETENNNAKRFRKQFTKQSIQYLPRINLDSSPCTQIQQKEDS